MVFFWVPGEPFGTKSDQENPKITPRSTITSKPRFSFGFPRSSCGFPSPRLPQLRDRRPGGVYSGVEVETQFSEKTEILFESGAIFTKP